MAKADDAARMRSQLVAQEILQAVDGKTTAAGVAEQAKQKASISRYWRTQRASLADTDARALFDSPLIRTDKPRAASKDGPIDQDIAESGTVDREEVALPAGYAWTILDPLNDQELDDVTSLLDVHYLCDPRQLFRVAYPKELVRWMLTFPHREPAVCLGVRATATGKLVAFDSGVGISLRIHGQNVEAGLMNLLCVHAKLREKKLAAIVMREISRRGVRNGYDKTVFSSSMVLPLTPYATTCYLFRAINPKKLVESGYLTLPAGLTMGRLMARNRLPEKTALPGLREVEEADLPQLVPLLQSYNEPFLLAPIWTEELVRHVFWSARGSGTSTEGRRKGQCIWSYVVEDPSTSKITGLVSWFTQPLSCLEKQAHARIETASILYYALDETAPVTAATVKASIPQRTHIGARLTSLMQDALVLMRDAGFDVCNVLSVGHTALFAQQLKFIKSVPHYQYMGNYAMSTLCGGLDPENPGSELNLVMP